VYIQQRESYELYDAKNPSQKKFHLGNFDACMSKFWYFTICWITLSLEYRIQ
jgi:hypothetical protein